MNKEKVMELAHKHNALVIQQGVASATEEWLTTFANAVIAAHTEELMQGVGEPVHEVWCSVDSCNEYYGWEPATDLSSEELAALGADAHRYIYSAERVAAAVAQERDRCAVIAQEISDKLTGRIDEMEAELQQLESTLKVAIGGMESVEPAIAEGYRLTRVSLLELIEKCKEVLHD